jgi:hypothetical protein
MTIVPNIYIASSEGDVIEKLNVYQKMARKFINKNNKYQPIWKIYTLPDNNYCLIFKLINKNHKTVQEQKQFFEESESMYWNMHVNSYVQI